MDKIFDSVLDKNLVLVCLYCAEVLCNVICFDCNEYKGVMTMADWEEYTGEVWEA